MKSDLDLINTTLGSPFQAGGSIANTAFGISGTLPAFASTPTFNLGTLNGAATSANQATIISDLGIINATLGSPFQAGGSIGNSSFGISGTLPAFAATPTFNLGTLNGAATAANQSTIITDLGTINSTLGSPMQNSGGTVTAKVVADNATSGTITAADASSTVVDSDLGQIIVTGSPTAGSVASFSLSNVKTVRVQITGTWTSSGGLEGELSFDGGITWYPEFPYLTGSLSSGNTAFYENFSAVWNVATATNFRIHASYPGPWTGTATVAVVESANDSVIYIPNTMQVTELNSTSILDAIYGTNITLGSPMQNSGGSVTANLGTLNGAATAANQATANTDLASILSALGSPFQAGGSIGNTTFGATQSGSWTNACTQTTAANLNATVVTTGGATIAKDSSLSTINTTLGSPFQAGGSIGNSSFGISGTLPAFASTPTFNLGTLNGAATATNQSTMITNLGTINTTLGSPFQAGGSIGNTSFTCNAGTNLNTSALATDAHLTSFSSANHTDLGAINTTLGSPMQMSGGFVSLAGSLPSFTSTPTFNALQSGTWSVGRTWTLGYAGDSVTSYDGGTKITAATMPSGGVGLTGWESAIFNAQATSALQTTGNTSLASILTVLGSPMQNSGGSVTANLGTIGTAATAANQTTINTSLGTINTTLGTPMQNSGGSVTVTGTAATSLSAANAPVNPNGSLSARQTVTSTESNLAAPTNAVGVIVECESVNADNLRWGFSNSTPAILSSTLGMLCEPGRDTGYIPIGAGSYLHLISTGGGSDYADVQWVNNQ
jgi:hypothetical protein